MAIELHYRSKNPVLLISRILIGVTALAVAIVVGLHSFANALGPELEARAAALAPWDGNILGRYARSIVLSNPDMEKLAAAEAFARRALMREPTSTDALVALGIGEQGRNNETAARQYFAIAERLSRRDLFVQLWAIEDAVKRNDIPGAINEYDIALRRAPSAQELLFPVLAGSISDPEIDPVLIKTLATRPPWASSFMTYLAKSGRDPRATAKFLANLQSANIEVPGIAKATLTNSLVATGAIDDAWRLYSLSHPNADRRRSRDPQFRSNSGSPTSFDWQLFGENGTSISNEKYGDSNALAFSVSRGSGGLLVRQLQLLTPGRYVLRGKSSGLAENGAPRPYWELKCVDGRVVAKVDLPASDKTGETAFAGMVEIPANCGAQFLSLVAPRHEMGGDFEGYVLETALEPVGYRHR